jgi:hypothetical protein
MPPEEVFRAECEDWIEGVSGDGLGNGRAPSPRTKRLRFFNVDNSNLRRARVLPRLTLRVYQRKRAAMSARRWFGTGSEPGLGWSNTFQGNDFGTLQGKGFEDMPWQVRD